MSFQNSVASYPNRGNYGKSSYRGNCTGHIIRDFCESYLKTGGLLVDPSIGGGTSQDVAQAMGINFVGTDLSQGFNLLTDDLGGFVGAEADCVWWHPPYWNMIRYSGNQWGEEANPWDLSQMNINDFTEALILAMMNIHDATKSGGYYGILMGNMRKQGKYYNFSSLIERVAPARLVDEIIKVQHNTMSDSRSYNGKLVRIAHEKLLVFKKEATAALYFLAKTMNRLEQGLKLTWKAAIRRVLQTQKKTWSLAEVYEKIKPFAEQKENEHWKAKVRQTLADERYFKRVDKGVYELVA
ncbi:DNA adenine modification methylase [Psychrobacter sp. PG1]|uniref:DNA adenine modification methylase n=1 Tax=unclassified Psychrobacter TaxID=196806 RepID=UPI00186812A5|nr:DNA adenine modification methylase [Psychrobacter sp. PG1]